MFLYHIEVLVTPHPTVYSSMIFDLTMIKISTECFKNLVFEIHRYMTDFLNKFRISCYFSKILSAFHQIIFRKTHIDQFRKPGSLKTSVDIFIIVRSNIIELYTVG